MNECKGGEGAKTSTDAAASSGQQSTPTRQQTTRPRPTVHVGQSAEQHHGDHGHHQPQQQQVPQAREKRRQDGTGLQGVLLGSVGFGRGHVPVQQTPGGAGHNALHSYSQYQQPQLQSRAGQLVGFTNFDSKYRGQMID